MFMRDVLPADLGAILALNNEHAREVNALTLAGLSAMVGLAARARVIDPVRAFLVAFSQATPVQGPNHAWFLAREQAFLYVDRVVVRASERGLGLGRALYDDLAAAAGGHPLCCEVNVEPPNPESLAFHARLGFSPCGEATDPRTGKRVQYLIRR